MTFIVNKEFKFTTKVFIDSSADQNYIREGLIPTKYFEKITERFYGTSGKKTWYSI